MALYDFFETVDLLLGLDLPFFFRALMLLTSEFFTPNLFFLAAFFLPLFLGAAFLAVFRAVFFAAFFVAFLAGRRALFLAAFFLVAIVMLFYQTVKNQ